MESCGNLCFNRRCRAPSSAASLRGRNPRCLPPLCHCEVASATVAIRAFRRGTLSRNTPRSGMLLSLPDLLGQSVRIVEVHFTVIWNKSHPCNGQIPLQPSAAGMTELKGFSIIRGKAQDCYGQIATVDSVSLAMTRRRDGNHAMTRRRDRRICNGAVGGGRRFNDAAKERTTSQWRAEEMGMGNKNTLPEEKKAK